MLEPKAIRNVPWAVLTYGANKGVTVVATLVLARLLVPADFGVVALASVLVTAFAFLADLGLAQALILRQDLEGRARGTLLTLMLASAATISAVAVASAPLAAWLLDEPRLRDVMFALGAGLVLNGWTSFADASLQRELEFRSRFAAQMVQTAAYAVIAIGAAALGAGVWALVAGQLGAAAAYGAALARVQPARVRPAWDPRAAREAVRVGRGFWGQGALAFVKLNVDYLAVGRTLGAAPLGIYSMGYRLAELPYLGIGEPVARVTFAGFVRMRARGEDVRGPFLTSLQLVALCTALLGVLLSACAEPLVRSLLGDRWLALIGPLTILGVWGAIRPIYATSGWLLNALGLAGTLARVSALVLLVLIPALFAAAALGGLVAVAWVLVAEATITTVVLGALLSRHASVPASAQWRALWPVVAAGATAWVSARLVADVAQALPSVVALIAAGGTGAAAYLLTVRLVAPRVLGRAMAQVRRSLARDPARAAA